jgi:hypothetical protein
MKAQIQTATMQLERLRRTNVYVHSKGFSDRQLCLPSLSALSIFGLIIVASYDDYLFYYEFNQEKIVYIVYSALVYTYICK